MDESSDASADDESERRSTDAGLSDATTGTFLVTHADEGSAVLRDVTAGQVHTLAENPGVEPGEVLEATIAPEPPLEVAWRVVEIERRRRVELVDSDLEPTRRARELVAERSVGEVVRQSRAGEGEVHVIAVPEDRAREAVSDVLEDEETLARAARIGAVRVEVRTGEGLVSVRYLPD